MAANQSPYGPTRVFHIHASRKNVTIDSRYLHILIRR